MIFQTDYKNLIRCILSDTSVDVIKSRASNSFFNYHVKGLNYYCLKRSPSDTIKLYHIEPNSKNQGFLVGPHNHRYEFLTHVLFGALDHVRFKKYEGGRFNTHIECRYFWETKTISTIDRVHLSLVSQERHSQDAEYFVRPDEIHTLLIHKPVILGIRQGPDINEDARLYLGNEIDFKPQEISSMSPGEYLDGLAEIFQKLYC